MWIASLLAAVLLAYANGANDNFKGVATLFGSHSHELPASLALGLLDHPGGIDRSGCGLRKELLDTFFGEGLGSRCHCLCSSVFSLSRTGGGGHSSAGHLPWDFPFPPPMH